MTREELLNNRAYNISIAAGEYHEKNPAGDSMTAFEEGANWADEHPKEANGKELLYVCQRTGEIIKKEMIIKTCKWLENYAELTGIDFETIKESFIRAIEE